MSRYCFIFARGGSKGVPRKNIKEMCGKPLISYAIEVAQKSELFKDIIVSTDSQEIADIAKQYGASVPFMRPTSLATDKAPEWLSWQHAVNYVKNIDDSFSTFVSLPCTAPLRTVETVKKCVELFEKNRHVNVITCTESHSNPYFNMVKKDEQSNVSLVCPSSVTRRQDAPKTFNITTVAYVSSPEIILSTHGLFDSPIKAVEVDSIEATDIDSMLDFQIAEFLMGMKNNG